MASMSTLIVFMVVVGIAVPVGADCADAIFENNGPGKMCDWGNKMCGRDADGIQKCLPWDQVACAKDYDLSKGFRPAGLSCHYEYLGWVCAMATSDGVPDSVMRCIKAEVAECTGEPDGSKCTHGQCRVTPQSARCLYPNQNACHGKDKGAFCLFENKYSKKLNSTINSKCSFKYRVLTCVEAEKGVCVNEDEGEPCGYVTYEDGGCALLAKRQCQARDFAKKTYTGGMCTGIEKEKRKCTHGKSETTIVYTDGPTSNSFRSGTVLVAWLGSVALASSFSQ